jgi:anti-anti-sigma regulatory factor
MTNKTFCAHGLRLSFEERSDETVVRCCGKITAASGEMLQQEIQGNLIPGSRGKLVAVNSRIVLDISGVSSVDSAGLESILALWTAGQDKCCALEIVNIRTGEPKLLTTLQLMLVQVKSLLQRRRRLVSTNK